jgi:gliding motility-associated-like protein
VHIFNADQCYIQDSVQLILGEDKDCVEITELITPNNDGKNDVLFLSFVAQYPNHKLSIFNRWGSLVYEKKNYQNDWSGIANTGALAGKGEKLPVGTYFYIFDPGNGDKPKRGFIELQY